MPTFTVETNVCTPTLRKRFSRIITKHMQQENIHVNHVITKYYELDPSCVYSGLVPFDRFPALAGKVANFAFVACSLSEERDTSFQKRLVRAIHEALQPEVTADFVFITFHPVNPRLTVVGQSGLQTLEDQI